MSEHDRPAEQPAVKTTIVGGRPPGPGKPVGAIPRGIEVLVKKAAVDPEFRTVLLEKRAAAADEIGLVLDPAEAMMLKAAPAAQLEAIIAQTRVHPSVLPAFLGRAAAVMLVALGAGTLGCVDQEEAIKGIEPDRPPAKEIEPPQNTPVTEGARPDRPPAQSPPVKAPERVLPSDGIRPDRPGEAEPGAESVAPPEAGEEEQPPAADAAGTEPTPSRPDSGANDPVTRGIRPDRPPTTQGLRPDRPPAEDVSGPDQPESTPPSSAATTAAEEPEASAAERPQPIVSRTFAMPAEWEEAAIYDKLALGLKRLLDAHLPGAKFIYSANDDGQKYIRIEYKPTEEKVQKTSEATGGEEAVAQIAPEDDGLLLTVWMDQRLIEADRPRIMEHSGERRWWTRIDQVYVVPHQKYLKWNLHYGPKTNQDVLARFLKPDNWFESPQPALVTKTYPANVTAVPSFSGTMKTYGTKQAKQTQRSSFEGTFGIQPDRPE